MANLIAALWLRGEIPPYVIPLLREGGEGIILPQAGAGTAGDQSREPDAPESSVPQLPLC